MSFTDKIIKWIFKNVKFPKATLHEVIDKMDADKDEYINIDEFVLFLKALKGLIR